MLPLYTSHDDNDDVNNDEDEDIEDNALKIIMATVYIMMALTTTIKCRSQ